MPIYEYYCPACGGHFTYLARRIGEAPAACPGCGHQEVERLISKVGVVMREASAPRNELNVKDTENSQAIARSIKESGWLEQAEGAFRSDAYRELIERRAAGATDADLADLNDSLGAEFSDSAYVRGGVAAAIGRQLQMPVDADGNGASQTAGEVLAGAHSHSPSCDHEHGCSHDHDHDHESHEESDLGHQAVKIVPAGRRKGRNLGWA